MTDLRGKRVWVMAKGYTPDEGGMQTYARSVAEAYAAIGARVTVFTRTSAGPRECTVGSVAVVDFGMRKSLPATMNRIAALLRRRRCEGPPDLLHATTWRTSVLPLLLGMRYVTTFHGREFMYVGRGAHRLMRHVARRAALTVTVSEYSARALQRQIPDLANPPLVAWNGVTSGLRRPENGPGHPPQLLALCRLEPRKNVAAAVRATARCRDQGYTFRFTICGRGPEQDHIATLVRQLRLEDTVTLAGFVDQERAVELYRDADIFVHPQITVDDGRDFEGFGIAVADAMYSRTAVIAGANGGTAELIDHGRDGLLLDRGDPEAIAAALRQLLDDTAQQQAMADAAARRADKDFRWDRHVQRILESMGLTRQRTRDRHGAT